MPGCAIWFSLLSKSTSLPSRMPGSGRRSSASVPVSVSSVSWLLEVCVLDVALSLFPVICQHLSEVHIPSLCFVLQFVHLHVLPDQPVDVPCLVRLQVQPFEQVVVDAHAYACLGLPVASLAALV